MDKYQNESHQLNVATQKLNEELLHMIRQKDHNSLNSLFLNQSAVSSENFSHDTLLTVLSVINTKQNAFKKDIYKYCRDVIYLLSINSEPFELLLSLTKQMEISNSQDLYCFFLDAIKICLTRNFTDKAIDICSKNIQNFLLKFDLPENVTLSIVNDNIIENIILSYLNLIKFSSTLVPLMQSLNHNDIYMQNQMEHNILYLLLTMFGKPICYINLDNNNCKIILLKLLKSICLVKCDIIYFFQFVTYGNLEKYSILSSRKQLNCVQSQGISTSPNINDLCLSNFFWFILHKTSNVNIFSVYNPHYITFHCINISIFLMENEKESNVMISKSLDILSYALNCAQKFPIPFDALDLPIHYKLVQNITNIINLNNSEAIKKFTTELFIQYICIFDNRAQCALVKHIIHLDFGSKINGIVINILKNIIVKQTNSTDDLFSFNDFKPLLFRLCTLQSETDTDLLEISDQLIVTLNFILFLSIRYRQNSEIVNYFSRNQFLKTLKKAAQCQKDEWFSKLNDLQNNSKASNSNNIELNHKYLSFFSSEQQLFICNKAINTLLIIENILERIHEIINK